MTGAAWSLEEENFNSCWLHDTSQEAQSLAGSGEEI